MKFKECLEFEQGVVKKLPSLVTSYLLSDINLVKFVVSLHICSWRVAWLHGCGDREYLHANRSEIGDLSESR